MSTKTLSLSEEAYESLRLRKNEAESFSEVVVRLAGKRPLASFAGVLSMESADALGKEIKETRAIHRHLHVQRVKHDFRH